ncbi:MAG TPA: hypothetical protein VHO94_03040 [Oscillospiraceae bacterium]|nr:hypothetical protein [Oscillospiraceae bacterium]
MNLSILFFILGLIFIIVTGIAFFDVKSYLNRNGENSTFEMKKRILMIAVFSILASISLLVAAILR